MVDASVSPIFSLVTKLATKNQENQPGGGGKDHPPAPSAARSRHLNTLNLSPGLGPHSAMCKTLCAFALRPILLPKIVVTDEDVCWVAIEPRTKPRECCASLSDDHRAPSPAVVYPIFLLLSTFSAIPGDGHLSLGYRGRDHDSEYGSYVCAGRILWGCCPSVRHAR